ncbi:MAG TPA: NAD(P)/FAD-dependent oxidoreductase [Spirochaetia bacterium]|nr:NAD(P)/FAD-dependent oxidoreductase [Spirochaetia bacterium]
MAKKVAIIGAGIAGLAAGCYARMNGFDAEIFESHTKPGGLCTAWSRKGYTFDGCIHWLTGSAPADSFYEIWHELGALEGRTFVDPDIFCRFIAEDGQVFNTYTDIDRLQAHMLQLSPEDVDVIDHFCGLIRKFTRFSMRMSKAPELFNALDIASLLVHIAPYMKDLRYCDSISVGDYAARFRSPLLRDSIARLLSCPDMTLTGVVITLALLHNRAGGFPVGGSFEFARGIERRFLELGGSVHYLSQVLRIPTADGRAIGLSLADGREVPADYVISAGDLRTTLYGMLEGEHIDPQHKDLLENYRLFPSMVQVSFGIDMKFEHDVHPMSESIRLEKPIRIGSGSSDVLHMKDYGFDQSFAPPGKSVVTCGYITDDYSYWDRLSEDRAAYNAEKKRIAAETGAIIERIHPGFTAAIEVVDVVTPFTYHRYAGTWKGTFMTWLSTPETATRLRTIRKTVPGLSNFYLAGMWVQPPGGVPSGALAARNVVQMICRQEKKRFSVTVPQTQRAEQISA